VDEVDAGSDTAAAGADTRTGSTGATGAALGFDSGAEDATDCGGRNGIGST
jgi:hypothetical protein